MMEAEVRNEFAPQSPGGLKFDRRILFRSYRKRFSFILILTLIVMVCSGIYVKIFIKPSWKSHCFLIRYPKNMSTPSEMPYLYQSFDLNTILETVRTRNVLLEVIRRLKLKETPEQLYGSIDVQRGNRSNVLNLSVTNPDPRQSADIANTLAKVFIENNNQLQNSSTYKIYDYYLKQRAERMRLLDQLELQAEQFRAQHGVISLSDENQNKFDLLKAIELKKIDNDLSINEYATKINDLNDKLKSLPKEAIQSYTYTTSDETKLVQLTKELELLRTKYTDENPKIRKILAEISNLQKVIASGAKGRSVPDQVSWGPNGLIQAFELDKSRFEGALQAAEKGASDYNNQISSLKAQLENLSQLQKDYYELQRRIDLNKDVLRIIEGRIAESKMAMESNVSDFDILEKARPPLYAEGSKRKFIVLALGMFVFVLGSVFVIGKEFLDFNMKSEIDFTEGVGIPMVGQIPNEEEVEAPVFYRNMQILLDNIFFRLPEKRPSIITVGSDVPETGKSYVIQELLKLLQSHDKKIVYIDTVASYSPDIEPYVINDALFSPYLAPSLRSISDNIKKGYFFTSDDIFKTILTKDQVRSFYDHLKDFDYIIWEMFEINYNVQLFTTIAAQSDLVALVARFRHSGRFMLKHSVEFMKERNIKNIVGVLNYIDEEYFEEKI